MTISGDATAWQEFTSAGPPDQSDSSLPQEVKVSLPFRSILFGDTGGNAGADERSAPDFFQDLNIDQILGAVIKGRDGYNLAPFFATPLTDVDAVVYRQEVFQDLEREQLHQIVATFAGRMERMRSLLRASAKVHYRYEKERWFLNAVAAYCEAVTRFASDLTQVDIASRGFLALREDLARYANSDRFTALGSEARRLLNGLTAVRYCVLTKGTRITVGHYDGEADYSDQVVKTFERFQQGAVKDYRIKLPMLAGMDHVEAGVLDLVAKLFPDLFGALDAFCSEHRAYLDAAIGRFDREVQFYLSYLDHLNPLRDAGLTFCYPQISAQAKEVQANETFDLALATKLVGEKSPVVCNDFYLSAAERILVVSGPNQGGKTTLARTFGQLHYLASLGCPVPGRDVRVFLPDRIFTHFEREEDLSTLAGNLEDELRRIHAILDRATPSSVIILNEIFTSTTLRDALFLSGEVLGQIAALDALCLCVTFIDELSTLNEKTVSMVSTVAADDPAVRTYKLIRKPADGRAYAQAIAEKYALTYDSLKGRITS